MIIHGYHRGVSYLEKNNKYYNYYKNLNEGAWNIFESVISVIDKVNDTLHI